VEHALGEAFTALHNGLEATPRCEVIAVNVRGGNGIHLPDAGLWLDPRRKAPLAVVSHAHSDHAGWHSVTIATKATLDLMRARRKIPAGVELVELAYYEPYQTEKATITLIPAGHILGSAQVLVETEDGRLLYTGDFKRRESLTCERATSVQVDTLVMECTFGIPKYAFPAVNTVRSSIIGFCEQTLAEGVTPVLLAYSLGKSQELLALLAQTSMPVMVHRSVAVMSAVYERYGVDLGNYTIWKDKNHEGKVLIIPPQIRSSLEKNKETRTAVISGWAIDRSAIYRNRCDVAFPLSDHADHRELIEHVNETGAKRVYTVHGFTEEFACELRVQGVDALALGGGNQLELFR
jgi:Cft2 family RNA processing exonuclease